MIPCCGISYIGSWKLEQNNYSTMTVEKSNALVKISISPTVAKMHPMFDQVLMRRDLSRAGDLFSLPDADIVDSLSEVLLCLRDLAASADYLNNDNDQSVLEICIARVTSCIRDTNSIERHCPALIHLLHCCLGHDLKLPSNGIDSDPPHAKIAADVISCIFLNYSKNEVMRQAIPVAVKFLHKGNKELTRSLASYLSLAALDNADLLAKHIQIIIDSIIGGNYMLARVLPQIYAVNREPVHDHVMALVVLLPLCELPEKLALLSLFTHVARSTPSVLDLSLPQLIDCLKTPGTVAPTLVIIADMTIARPFLLTGDYLKRVKNAIEQMPTTLTVAARIIGAVGATSKDKSDECVEFLVCQLSRSDLHSATLSSLLREIERLAELNPVVVSSKSRMDRITNAVYSSATLSAASSAYFASIRRIHEKMAKDSVLPTSNLLLTETISEQQFPSMGKLGMHQQPVPIGSSPLHRNAQSRMGTASTAAIHRLSFYPSVKPHNAVHSSMGRLTQSNKYGYSMSAANISRMTAGPAHFSPLTSSHCVTPSAPQPALVHRGVTVVNPHGTPSGQTTPLGLLHSQKTSSQQHKSVSSLTGYSGNESYYATPASLLCSPGVSSSGVPYAHQSPNTSANALTSISCANHMTMSQSLLSSVPSVNSLKSSYNNPISPPRLYSPSPTTHSQPPTPVTPTTKISISGFSNYNVLNSPSPGTYRPIQSSNITSPGGKFSPLKVSPSPITVGSSSGAGNSFVGSYTPRQKNRKTSGEKASTVGASALGSNQRISVFEPYPLARDGVQHFCEKHLDKIKTYMEKVAVKLPLPVKCTIEEKKNKKFAKLSFVCQCRGEHCLYSRTMFTMITKNARFWIHLMFLALQARCRSALSIREPSVSCLKMCWDILKSDTGKSFLTLVTSAFPSVKDQETLLNELRGMRYFDVFEYNGSKQHWACFLCNHPERASDFVQDTEQPVIQGQLKEQTSKWRLFRRWRTRYFTLSPAHLSVSNPAVTIPDDHGPVDDVLLSSILSAETSSQQTLSTEVGGATIDVSQITSVRALGGRSGGRRGKRSIPRAFEVFTPDRSIILKAKDGRHSQEWVQCLSIAIARYQASHLSFGANATCS